MNLQVNTAPPALEEVRTFLRAFLDDKQIKVDHKGMFSCINPDHKDSNPSCGIVPASEGKVFKCFGCGFKGNIFTAAHILEDMAIQGEFFWKITLPALAERYGVDYEPEEISEEDRKILTKLHAYRDAADTITNCSGDDSNLVKYLADRGWSAQTAARLKIGAIPSVEEYTKAMNKIGWSTGYMRDVGLLSEDIFNARNLIFTIKDHAGNPVAFSARNMMWASKEDGAKYFNSYNSDIYTKHITLYNLTNTRRKMGPLIIVEGYADVAGIVEHNPKARVAAICGTNLEKEQITAIRKENITNIELAFDNDYEGQKAMLKVVKSFSEDPSGLMVKIVELPEDKDPGEAASIIDDCPRVSPFEWMLKRSMTENHSVGEDVAQEHIPAILLILDRVERYARIKQLSKVTEVPLSYIQDEVQRRSNIEDFQKKERLHTIKEYVIRRLSKEEDLDDILMQGTQMVQALEDEFCDNNALTEETYANDIRKLRSLSESGEDRTSRLHLSNMEKLSNYIDGFPSTALFGVVGGIPHAGKTSFLRALAWNLVKNNPEVTVIYHTVDEPLRRMLPPLVALQAGVEISNVKHLHSNDEDTIEKIRDSWSMVEDLGLRGRFIVKDIRAGNTLDSIERLIRTYQDKYPERKLVYFFDNFHKLGDYPTSDKYSKYTACSKRAQNIALKYDIPLIMTVELKKIDTRTQMKSRQGFGMGTRFAYEPRPEDILQTGSLWYDTDIVWLLHNDLQVNPVSKHCWIRTTHGDIYQPGESATRLQNKMPVLDIIWAKNREAGTLGRISYKYDPAKNSFEEIQNLPQQQSEETQTSYSSEGAGGDISQAPLPF